MYSNKVTSFQVLVLIILFSNPLLNSQTKTPDWSYNKSIYEVNIRQYTPEGTFAAFEKHLPRLKEMGVGILWLMPINPIGELNRKGTEGSYYSVKDYKGVNAEFGTAGEFRSLVNKIHELGMYVIIDWVANHTSWDNHLVKDHPEWYTKDDDGNFVPPVADWSDVIDLNYENKDLWKYMTDALKYWVEEFDIDGYRCDVAGMVPTEFWIQARKELDKIKPVFMLAEWNTPEMHQAFDMTYAWDHHHLMNDVAKGEKTALQLKEYYAADDVKYPDSAFRMLFTSNHDENSWNGTVFERLGDAAEVFAVYKFLVPGMPLIYSGQEAGLNKRLEFFEKDPIEWKEHKLADVYTKLIRLKLNNKSLHNGEKSGSFIPVLTNIEDSIHAFIREKEEDKIIAIFNLSNSQKEVDISSPLIADEYTDYFTGEKLTFGGAFKTVLKPWDYKIYIR